MYTIEKSHTKNTKYMTKIDIAPNPSRHKLQEKPYKHEEMSRNYKTKVSVKPAN